MADSSPKDDEKFAAIRSDNVSLNEFNKHDPTVHAHDGTAAEYVQYEGAHAQEGNLQRGLQSRQISMIAVRSSVSRLPHVYSQPPRHSLVELSVPGLSLGAVSTHPYLHTAMFYHTFQELLSFEVRSPLTVFPMTSDSFSRRSSGSFARYTFAR
jgi:hypothetical protein